MQEKTSAKQPQKMVKIKFKHPMRNINLTHDDYLKCQNEYLKELKDEFGTPRALPGETETILNKIAQKHGQPYIYLKGMIYEIPESDADHYLKQCSKPHLEDDQPHFFDGEDGQRLKEKFMTVTYYAEIVH